MFCDYCTCERCQYGENNISHALTIDHKWICDVCYLYDLCTTGNNKNLTGNCENENCIHRPKLISGREYLKFKEN